MSQDIADLQQRLAALADWAEDRVLTPGQEDVELYIQQAEAKRIRRAMPTRPTIGERPRAAGRRWWDR